MRKIQLLAGGANLIEFESLEEHSPRVVLVVTPPDKVVPLPTEELQFDLNGHGPYAGWIQAHRVLAATMVQETGLLSGARFGRLNREAYQLAGI